MLQKYLAGDIAQHNYDEQLLDEVRSWTSVSLTETVKYQACCVHVELTYLPILQSVQSSIDKLKAIMYNVEEKEIEDSINPATLNSWTQPLTSSCFIPDPFGNSTTNGSINVSNIGGNIIQSSYPPESGYYLESIEGGGYRVIPKHGIVRHNIGILQVAKTSFHVYLDESLYAKAFTLKEAISYAQEALEL